MMPGVVEEEDEEMEQDLEYEEVDQFGPELLISGEAISDRAIETEPASPISPMPDREMNPLDPPNKEATGSGVPLTAEALAKLGAEEEAKEAEEIKKSKSSLEAP